MPDLKGVLKSAAKGGAHGGWRSLPELSGVAVGGLDYMLKRWAAFTRFLDDGRICLTNNAAERGLRGIALGRKAWLFAGSDEGVSVRPRCIH